MTTITRSISEPIRKRLSWEETWKGDDKGLIKCWENGREFSQNKPDLAQKALNGEYPILGWKGGVDKKLKLPIKYGTYNYLATWQGLRNESLNINLEHDTEVRCSKTGMKIIFTADASKWKTA